MVQWTTGICACGCGTPTNISPRTAPRYGIVKGQPYRYVLGHNRRNSALDRSKSSPQRTHDRRLASGRCQYCGDTAIDVTTTKGCAPCKAVLLRREARRRAAIAATRRCQCGARLGKWRQKCNQCVVENRRKYQEARRVCSAAD